MFRKPVLATLLAALAFAALSGGAAASVTNTRIVSGPTGTVAADPVAFAFTSPEDGGFQCRLDDSEWTACTSPQSYEGLADGPHTFRVRALNRAGHPDPTPSSRSFTVETIEPEPEPAPPAIVPPVPAAIAIDSGPPKPVAGQSFNVEPVEGTVELQCPGEDAYSRLTSFKQIPMGCLVNTRHGTIGLTSSKGSSGDLQDADFWGGVFVVTQQEGDDQEVELKLAGKRMCEKRSSERKAVARSSRSKRGGRRAWGSGKGNYETSGSYGSATVRGTTWLVVDRCDASTLIRVAEGTVWARDFLKEKTVVLTAGEQYIAKAPIPRLNPSKFP
ncbi:MAG TPA: hypothetical protein VHP56_00405 [Solirubrobacterales bacterium]|jgi:hypothetical protein|nr:hypothetical protein [Solirubrobacterales bacterium]